MDVTAGGGRLTAALEQVGGEGVHAGPVEHRGAALAVGPGEEAAYAVAVGLHRLGARALGARCSSQHGSRPARSTVTAPTAA